MDTNAWSVFAQAAGIGGIALGVFLVLFRDIIRKKIFPTLKREDGYKLMRLITLCVWSIAVLGIVVWLAIQWKPSQQTTGDASPAFSQIDGDVTVNVDK